MKFDHLIECNKKNIFFKKHAENEAGSLISEALYEVKTSGLHLSFNMFR